MKYGIIGSGRLAKHFTTYFRMKQVNYDTWTRQDLNSPEIALQDCGVLLFLITDAAIEPLIQSEAFFLNHPKRIHCSGALLTTLAEGIHPLMTFPEELYSQEVYESISFVLEEGKTDFSSLFPQLKNPYYTIPGEFKANYHALCVMSGNFTVILWNKLFKDLQDRFQIPQEAALPFLQAIMNNLSSSPEKALTGPLQRGDSKTIQKNIRALEGDSFQAIYQAFVEAYTV
jgi:predicted short-subunit dehydrogenase-like oxidoreductase (DUF2520 family)